LDVKAGCVGLIQLNTVSNHSYLPAFTSLNQLLSAGAEAQEGSVQFLPSYKGTLDE
jgi:hypothetical protein